jgi:hypothetical protein
LYLWCIRPDVPGRTPPSQHLALDIGSDLPGWGPDVRGRPPPCPTMFIIPKNILTVLGISLVASPPVNEAPTNGIVVRSRFVVHAASRKIVSCMKIVSSLKNYEQYEARAV